MSIFVTGGAGFIGANFVLDWVANNEEPIISIDNLTYVGNSENRTAVEKNERYTFIQGSFGDKGLFQGLLVKYKPRAVFDVTVDLRKSSLVFGQWVGVEFNAENHRQLWLPEGFGHVFVVLSESAEFLYKTTHYYAKGYEPCIAWDDTEINIDWSLKGQPQLSGKNQKGVLFKSSQVCPWI